MARDYDHEHVGTDPDLPRMRPGLPFTPLSAIQSLALAVIAQGLVDDDDQFVIGEDEPWFNALLRIVGIEDPEIVLAIKLLYCHGAIDLKALRYMDHPRFQSDSMVSAAQAEGRWQSWPTRAPLGRP